MAAKKKQATQKDELTETANVEAIEVPEIELPNESEQDVIPLKTNGNLIREGIKIRKDRRDLLYRELDRAKATFEEDEERNPLVILDDIEKLNLQITLLQGFQTSYNQAVKVSVSNHPNPLTLTFFIKAVDSTSQQLRVLKEMLDLENKKGVYFTHRIRHSDQEVATSRVTDEELFERRIKISKQDANYRAAIATGNTQVIDVPEIIRFLFE